MGEETLDLLDSLGVCVCYASRIEHDVLWLPEDCLVILNAQASLLRLDLALSALMPEIEDRERVSASPS